MGKKESSEDQKASLKRIGEIYGPTAEMGSKLLQEWGDKNEKDRAVLIVLGKGNESVVQFLGTGPRCLSLVYEAVDTLAESLDRSVPDVLDMLNQAYNLKEKVMGSDKAEELIDKLKELRDVLRSMAGDDDENSD